MSALPRSVQTLRGLSLFERVEERSLFRFEASFTRRRLRGGANIWWMGDRAEHLTFIERGLVEIVRTGAGGDVSVIGLFGPGDTIGLPAALEDVGYPADAVVMSTFAEIARVSASEVRAAAAADALLAGAIQRALLDHTRVMLAKISVVSAGSVAARLATLFVHLADRFGTKDGADGRATVGVALTRATLAGFVDARVETVIRALSAWRASDIFRTTEEGFEIDRAALVAISREG